MPLAPTFMWSQLYMLCQQTLKAVDGSNNALIYYGQLNHSPFTPSAPVITPVFFCVHNA